MTSPYKQDDTSKWQKITDSLVNTHPLDRKEIVSVVLKSWDDIFNSKIGSFFIGKEIFPTPQIMSFLLHELVAHYLSLKYKSINPLMLEALLSFIFLKELLSPIILEIKTEGRALFWLDSLNQ